MRMKYSRWQKKLKRNGAKFYRDAEKAVSDPKEKALLAQLADMEDEHEKNISSMKKDLSEAEKAQTIFDPNDDAALYLKALADTKVFFKKSWTCLP